MGRIRNKTVKTAARKIHMMYPDRITADFEKNKVRIQEIAQIYSKKLRNQIAGYLVTLHKIRLRPKRTRPRKTEDKPRSDRSKGRGRGRGRGRGTKSRR
jgi:small subunit ribosomal protein S17e